MIKYPTVLAIAATLITSASAQIGLGIKAGTLGVGVDVVTELPVPNPSSLNFRVNGNILDWNADEKYSEVNYKIGLKLRSLGALVDWYAFKGSFHFTAGAYYVSNDNTLESLDQFYSVNGYIFNKDDAGVLRGSIKFRNDFAPYVGVGWGNAIGGNRRWNFFADLGALLTGDPRVTLSAQGGHMSNDPYVIMHVEEERQKVEKDLHKYKIYPVGSVGVAYRF